MESFIFLSLLASCAGFKVSMPSSHMVAVRGQPAILGCEFTPDSTPDLSPLIVTWQRSEDSRVIHSFYYKRDQLDVQSPDYRNRTSLFVSELQKGNASLRIEPVEPRDVGLYECIVSNNMGMEKGHLQVDYGAFYTEPRLTVNMSSSSVMLLYETEGFPKPEVRWIGEDGKVLSDHIELREKAYGAGGDVALYYMQSYYMGPSPPLNITFTLKNQLLNQNLLRPVSIAYGHSDGQKPSCTRPTACITVVCVLCVLVLIGVVLLIMRWRRLSLHMPVATNGNTTGTGNGIAMSPFR